MFGIQPPNTLSPMPPETTESHIQALETLVAELQRFVPTAAHELKAPLATVERFAIEIAAAVTRGDWERVRCDAERIQVLSQELRRLVDHLRVWSTADRAPVHPVDVPLADAAHAALSLLHDTLQTHSVRVEISPELPVVSSEFWRWRLVYQNLIDNAVKACAGQAQPRIEIGCEQRDGQVICHVHDNGRGVHAGDLEQIFAQFHHSGPHSGTGLGLALVRRIIEQHGGKVWAESSGPQTGTTIMWTLRS